jgi:hypothetical protein
MEIDGSGSRGFREKIPMSVQQLERRKMQSKGDEGFRRSLEEEHCSKTI